MQHASLSCPPPTPGAYIVGKDGIRGKLLVSLTEEENALLNKSSECLKDIIRNIQI